MTVMKLLLVLACMGHILCGIGDCLMTYTPKGKFQFSDMNSNDKMSATFEGMPLQNLIVATLLGVLAFSIYIFGYLALCKWVGQFSDICSIIMTVAVLLYLISITAHHVICGAVEWFYVRLGRTADVLNAVTEFFKETAITMYVGYFSLLVFAVAFMAVVVAGHTSLPRWACIFNTLPLFLILAPTKAPAKGNIAGAVMFLGLALLI